MTRVPDSSGLACDLSNVLAVTGRLDGGRFEGASLTTAPAVSCSGRGALLYVGVQDKGITLLG